MAPILTILTRRYKRPQMFEVHCGALRRQTSQDFQHLDIVDEKGIGNLEANKLLGDSQVLDKVKGRYVMAVDDDDEICDPTFVEDLAKLVEKEVDPPWIMVKAFLGGYGEQLNSIWPKPWGPLWVPQFKLVSGLNLVVRADLWKEYGEAWGVYPGGDFSFASALWEGGVRPIWHDRIVVKTQRISRGATE